MSRKVDHFIRFDRLSPVEACELFNYDARSVGVTLRALEAIKGRSFWLDRDAWIEGNIRLAQQQERLLMPCGEDIIREFRAFRNGNETPIEMQDPSLDPYTLPLVSLKNVRDDLRRGGVSVAESAFQATNVLRDIREKIGSEGDEGTLLWGIIRIAAVIVGV